jgi:hypothetical protein
MIGGTTAAGATPTLCRMGIYSVAANGNLTLIASTPNDTTLFATAGARYTRSLSTPFMKQSGQRYAVGLLIVTAAALPTIVGYAGSSAELAESPRIVSYLAGQGDLAATITDATLSQFNAPLYAALLP